MATRAAGTRAPRSRRSWASGRARGWRSCPRPTGSTRRSARCQPGCELRTHARGRLDVIVFFVTRRAELARRFPSFARALETTVGCGWRGRRRRRASPPTSASTRCRRSASTPAWSTTRCAPSTAPGRACASCTASRTAAVAELAITGASHVRTVRLGVVAAAPGRALRRRGDRGRRARSPTTT